MTLNFRILTSVLIAALAVAASEPVEWTAKPGDGPKSFVRHHGSTLEFKCAFAGFGSAFANESDVRLWYQTNGMGQAWWSVPATRSNDVLVASWPPSADPGADRVSFFFGAPSNAYASAVVRLQHSPGFTPNVVSAPVQTIDFADVTASNAPWIPLSGGFADTLTVGGVLNVTDWMVVDFSKLTDANDEDSILDRINAKLSLNSQSAQTVNGPIRFQANNLPSTWPYVFEGGVEFVSEAPTFFTGSIRLGDNYLVSSNGTLNLDGRKIAVDTDVSAIPDLVRDVNSISDTVVAWETYWDGDDVRVTVTNYDSQVNIPSLYLEQNTNTVVGGTAAYRVVWDERTRWDQFLAGYNAFATNVVENYADRAWGVYDSASGNYSPDGLLQISQAQIMIANGLAYQKTVTTGGCAVWVLQATDPTMVSGVTSNGYFRITDGDGNALFEIVKGDKRIVGATASSIVANNGMTITYNVTAADHPKLEIATELNGTWLSEGNYSGVANVSWTGSSGAWVATVTPIGNRPSMFAKASYETGGETYVKHSAPLGFSRIYVNGTNYNVHVETMNGKKVLVLQ